MIDVHINKANSISGLLRSSEFDKSSDVGNGVRFALHGHRLMKSSIGAMTYSVGVLTTTAANFLSSNPKMHSEVEYAALGALGLMATGSCIVLKQIVEGTKISIKFHNRTIANELGEFDGNKTLKSSNLNRHFSIKAFARANGTAGLFGITCSLLTSSLFLDKAIGATNAHEMLSDIGGIAFGALCTAAILRINSSDINDNARGLKKSSVMGADLASAYGSIVKRNKLKA